MDLVVATAALARVASRTDRLLPGRSAAPLHLSAGTGLELAAGDGDLRVRGSVAAQVHATGAAAVPRRSFATVLAGVEAPEVRLSVEGSRLAVRTPSGRFALPIVPAPAPAPGWPAAAGTVPAERLRPAALAVCGAASRDGLPIFTGVRLRSADGVLRLVATDRFRMASAAVAYTGPGIDVLVPAGILADAVRSVPAAGPVTLRASGGAFGLDWPDGGLATSSLALPFPDAQIDRLLTVSPLCTLTVDAPALLAAVARAAAFATAVTLEATDGVVVVRAGSEEAGESREEVKADVQGDRLTASYQAHYLQDGLRAFDGEVAVALQPGIAPTSFAATDDPAGLAYLVVPLRG
ncbi:DNA polymerase III subunit beta [Hamadaea tsunoensis]|uniref:DNA polymerase III subunit beta n=1 Tax=Hamadaea tsunoensis TaxID=53368 RepID=UPI0003FE64D6|nr:DNA polymerase III subunit beta [Hamadaea tsunoensis]